MPPLRPLQEAQCFPPAALRAEVPILGRPPPLSLPRLTPDQAATSLDSVCLSPAVGCPDQPVPSVAVARPLQHLPLRQRWSLSPWSQNHPVWLLPGLACALRTAVSGAWGQGPGARSLSCGARGPREGRPNTCQAATPLGGTSRLQGSSTPRWPGRPQGRAGSLHKGAGPGWARTSRMAQWTAACFPSRKGDCHPAAIEVGALSVWPGPGPTPAPREVKPGRHL